MDVVKRVIDQADDPELKFILYRWLGDGIAVVERSYGHLVPADKDVNVQWHLLLRIGAVTPCFSRKPFQYVAPRGRIPCS